MTVTDVLLLTDGSLSDSATGMLSVESKERRRATNGKQSQNMGLSKKSSSTSKLSDTGRPGVFLSLRVQGGASP